MTFNPTYSEHGTAHSSTAEARAAERLLVHGIVAYDRNLPVPYADKDGVVCHGRSDFADLELQLHFEWKQSRLNSKTSKAMADKALARLEKQLADGFKQRGSPSDRMGRLDAQFNHSAACIAAKQEAMHEEGHVFLLILGQAPDERTRRLLTKYAILWLQEGTREFQQFNIRRRLARIPGISVVAPICGYGIDLNPANASESTSPQSPIHS